MKIISNQDDWKPWIQRRSSWLSMSVVALGILAGWGMDSCRRSLKTELVECSVLAYKHTRQVDVYIWGTRRKYNRSSAPSCSWDVDKDTYYECYATDSTGTCIRGGWETDYDYSLREWVEFKSWEEEFNDVPVSDTLLKPFLNVHKYKVETRLKTKVFVTDGTRKAWLDVDHLPQTNVLVRRRVRSKKLLNVVE